MLLSAVSVLVVAQSISEIPEGLMNNPVYIYFPLSVNFVIFPFVLSAFAMNRFRSSARDLPVDPVLHVPPYAVVSWREIR